MKANPAFSAVFCLAFGFCLFACSKHDSKPTLSVSTNSLLLDSVIGAVDSFSVSSNVSWKLTVSPAAATSWLQVSQTTGSNSAIIRLTITGRNTNVTGPLTITVAAVSGSLSPQTITLDQQGALQVSNTSLTLKGTPVTDTLAINTGLAWKATASAGWIHLDTTQGAGSYRLKVSADTNRTGAPQSGTVTLTPLNNTSAAAITVNVTQSAYYAILSFSPLSGAVGSTITLNGYFPSSFSVTMNNSSAAAIVSHSTTQIVCTVPGDATGGYLFANIPSVFPSIVSTQQFTVTSAWKSLSDNTAGLPGYNPGSLVYTYNGALYTGFGATGSQTIYRLDTTTFHWVPAISIPASVQVIQYPTWFVINNKLYVGGGYCTTCLSFYEYDMTQGNNPGAWRSLTALPENVLNGSGFALGGYGYMQPGEYTSVGNNILYQFSTTGPSDPGTWTTLGPLNIKDGPAASFIVGNTVYFGGGSATSTDPTIANAFFAMVPPSIILTAIAPIPEPVNPSPGQRFSTWTVGNIAYAFDIYNQTLFSYDPAGNSWTSISTIPGSQNYGRAAWFNGHVYAWNSYGAVVEYIP